MSLTRWLGETPLQDFIEEHYLRLPFSGAGGGAGDCTLGSWETLGGVLAREKVDVLVVRDNRRVDAAPPRSREDAESLAAEGSTILVRNAQHHDPALAELASGFERDFCGPVNIHIYATPGGRFGFGWHYDAEEVFILQTTGAKEYSLRKNTVNPWPLEESLPADMCYEREIMPLNRCLLRPGDWLYIPCGYWHKAEAKETSISLAVGVMAPSAIDLFDSLRTRLLDSLRWRQRLPIASGQRGSEQLQALAPELAADLRRALADPRFLEGFLQEQYSRFRPEG